MALRIMFSKLIEKYQLSRRKKMKMWSDRKKRSDKKIKKTELLQEKKRKTL